MDAIDLEKFNDAVALAQAGKKQEAYQRLKALSIATGAKDPSLLLWIAYTTSDLEEAETAIRMAEATNPNSQSVNAAYEWLRQQKLKIPPKQQSNQNTAQTMPPPNFIPPAYPANNQAYSKNNTNQRPFNFSGSPYATPNPPPNYYNPAPFQPQGVVKQPGRKLNLASILTLIAVFFVMIGITVIVVLLAESKPSRDSYTSYPTTSDLFKGARVGDLVQISLEVDNPGDDSYNLLVPYFGELYINLDRSIVPKVTPGYNTFYMKITDKTKNSLTAYVQDIR